MMNEEEAAVASWLIEKAIEQVEIYDSELREHLINASNRLYDIRNPDAD